MCVPHAFCTNLNFMTCALKCKFSYIFSLTETENSGWEDYDPNVEKVNGPRLLRAQLKIEEVTPKDTFFDYDCSPECIQWKHGAFFVNGFNIGRYHQAGPQKTLYIPGPLLKQGVNEVIICSSPLSKHKRLKNIVVDYSIRE